MTTLKDSTTAAYSDQSSAKSLVRCFSARYLLVLAAVALLIVLDQAVVQPLLLRLSDYAPAIDFAGRQRMLSQKLSKAALALEVANSNEARQRSKDELRTTLSEWATVHDALQRGDEQLGLPKLATPDISAAWIDLEPHFQAMYSSGCQLVEHTPTASSIAVDADELSGLVGIIVEHEHSYLPIMDHIVKLVARETQRKVAQLRLCAISIAGGIIALLLGLGWVVIVPATRTIRSQIDQLESRVDQRTRELLKANRALQLEMVERQQAIAKNQQLAMQLAHAARVSAMGHLTASLAHEINQPLGAIANYAEVCDLELSQNSPSMSRKVQRHIDQIKQAALRAGQIVRRIRNFTCPNPKFERVSVDVNILVREVVDLCRFDSLREKVHTTVSLSSAATPVLADPIQIQQVLVNLIQNSVQAMKACPTDCRQLHISTRVVDTSVQVEVRDTGPGFEIGVESLFEPFFTTKTNGLGIGLSICRSIVEHHQGTIWAESNLSGGAVILFTLPLLQEHDASRHQPADCVCG